MRYIYHENLSEYNIMFSLNNLYFFVLSISIHFLRSQSITIVINI